MTGFSPAEPKRRLDDAFDRMPPRLANFEPAPAVTLDREAADEVSAVESELGPNDCAATAD